MRRLPRREWLDWCDEQNHRLHSHLETAGPGPTRLVVTLIDYAPFDDILELDMDDHGSVSRRLIDHPDEIWVEDEDGIRAVVITSGTERLPLLLVDGPSPHPDGPRASAVTLSDFIPEPMLGAYFEG